MRRAPFLAVACLSILVTTSAGAESARDRSSTLADELLRIWNQEPAAPGEEGPESAPAPRDDLQLISLPDYLRGTQSEPVSEPAPIGFTAPDGTSLTPNIDRLMQQVYGLPVPEETAAPPSTLGADPASASAGAANPKAGGR